MCIVYNLLNMFYVPLQLLLHLYQVLAIQVRTNFSKPVKISVSELREAIKVNYLNDIKNYPFPSLLWLNSLLSVLFLALHYTSSISSFLTLTSVMSYIPERTQWLPAMVYVDFHLGFACGVGILYAVGVQLCP